MIIDCLDQSLGAFGLEDSRDIASEMVSTTFKFIEIDLQNL